jgi:hypothetical protein
MRTFRAITFLFMALFSALANASSASGIWTSTGGSYLVLMEQTSSGAVVAFSVSPTLQTGAVLLGSRSGDALTLKSLDAQATWTIALSGSNYTGTYTAGGSTQATSGHLLLAYGGSANDAIWQKSDGSARFLSTITLLSDGTQLMVLFDVRIGATISEVTYDVSAGAVQSFGASSSFIGKSLLSGNTVNLSFKGGSPATDAYSVVTSTRPFTTVEQFDVSAIFGVD